MDVDDVDRCGQCGQMWRSVDKWSVDGCGGCERSVGEDVEGCGGVMEDVEGCGGI